MGKISKSPEDTSKSKAVVSSSFKPVAAPSVKLPATNQPKPAKPISIHDVRMPSSAEGVTASSLTTDQKNLVKKGVQRMFHHVDRQIDRNVCYTLGKATENLSKLMEEAATKRKLEKKAKKQSK